MSRSELEEALYGQMRMLSMAEGSTFPLPVRELHPFWCCEHRKAEHAKAKTKERWWCFGCASSDSGAPIIHEYRRERDWRVDFAWPEQRLILEVEGGVWTEGRHTRGSGFTKDVEKYNALTAAGWTVYRVTQREVNSGEALRIAERALKQEA